MKLFTHHPHSIGETYFQHWRFAMYNGSAMVIGGIACMIHAIFPFLFQKTGSSFLMKLIHGYVERMPQVDVRVEQLSHTIQKRLEMISE